MPNKVKCPKCGFMNDKNKSHCANCGYKLDTAKEASVTNFMQSMYKTAMACPRAAGDVDLNTKNRDATIQKHNYGPLNLTDQGYWELVADKWNTTPDVAKKSKCGNCVAFDVSPRMDACMPGPVSDGDGRLGYCWMHHFKCHSARTCNTWAKGGPIKKDEVSHDWQKKSKGMEKEAFWATEKQLAALVGIPMVIGAGSAMSHNLRNDKKLTDNVGKGALYGAGVGLGSTLLHHTLRLDKAGIPNAVPYIVGSSAGGYLATKEASDGEYDDSHMLSKILMRMSAQSAHLKEKIDAGLILPSWAEYKLYNAYSSLGSALGTAYPGEYNKEADIRKGYAASTNAISRLKEIRDAAKAREALSLSTPSASMLASSKAKRELVGRLEGFMSDYKKKQQMLNQQYGKTASAPAIANSVAQRIDPETWEKAKQKAKNSMGGKHSARAMQLATKLYKDMGGRYKGPKPTTANNSLKKWTSQDWQYSGKDRPGPGGTGVYLPKKRIEALKSTEKGKKLLASASAKKRIATTKGVQYSSHGLAAGTSLKKTAESKDRTDMYTGLGASALGTGAILSNIPQKAVHKGGVFLVKNTGGPMVTPEEMVELSKKHGIIIQKGDKSSLRNFTDGSKRITLGPTTGNHATLAHELGHFKDHQAGKLINKSNMEKGTLKHTLATLRNEGVANLHAIHDRGLKQIPNAIGSYSTYLAGAAGRHRRGLAALSAVPLGLGGYKASNHYRNSKEKTASSSSRVVSPDAYYRPPGIVLNQPVQELNVGNSDMVNQQAQNAQQGQMQAQQSMFIPQPPGPSIQQNTSVTRPPPPPKLTGM